MCKDEKASGRYRWWMIGLAIYVVFILASYWWFVRDPSMGIDGQEDAEGKVVVWLNLFSYEKSLDRWNVDEWEKRRALGDGRWVELGKSIDGAEPVLLRLFETNDPRVEMPQVIAALGALGTKESVAALIEALEHEDPHVRIEAASALGGIGDARAEMPLCRALTEDKLSSVRVNAVVALEKLATDASIPFLQVALEDGSSLVSTTAKRTIRGIQKRNEKERRRSGGEE